MCVRRCTKIYKVLWTKTLESVTKRIHSLRGYQILSISIQLLKWQVFLMEDNYSEFQEELKYLKSLRETLNKKDTEATIKYFENMATNIKPLILAFNEFSRKCEGISKVCKYWNGIIEMTNRLKNLVSADKEGDWDNHVQAVKDLLLIFIEADSISYLR